MRISDILELRIGLLGFGREGHSTLGLLRRLGHDAVVHVLSDHADQVPPDTALNIGDDAVSALSNLDVLIRSPGFGPSHPIRQAADARRLFQTTSTNLFLGELRNEGLPVIGITGSKGKSTTSTLAHLVLQQAGIDSVLVGNIGEPALDNLERIVNDRLVTVMELSSYQCADLPEGCGPSVACLLDLFPEHLDWHGDARAYYDAKARIALTQRPGDRFRYNARSAFQFAGAVLPASSQAINTPAALHFADGWFCCGNQRLFPDTQMRLPGRHNRENAVAAFAVAQLFGALPEHLHTVLSTFGGLPYRLQDEGIYHGIHWVNDSLSTAPEAAAAALQALSPAVHTLIAGGYDRGYDVSPLIDAIVAAGVRTIVLLPQTGSVIARLARRALPSQDIIEVDTLDRAVIIARDRTPNGDTCLFSPGAPSYNLYASFQERGDHFRSLVTSR